MALYQLGDDVPRVCPTAWVADSATVIGRVDMAEGASVWYGACCAATTTGSRIGRNSNVQDGSVLHTDHGHPNWCWARTSPSATR
jgi:carbonic anhydrase/acetyltransferase-like protein (isoleucine patch superfamily)